MDYLYEQGKIYFHGAKSGHKIDAIKADNRVSFTVFDQGVPVEGKVGPDVRSVIVFGRVSLLDTTPETIGIARRPARSTTLPAMWPTRSNAPPRNPAA